jgi:hypothetical protein
MGVALLLARLLLTGVFGVAGLAKLADHAGVQQSLVAEVDSKTGSDATFVIREYFSHLIAALARCGSQAGGNGETLQVTQSRKLRLSPKLTAIPLNWSGQSQTK